MSAKLRRWILAVGLVIALVLSYWSSMRTIAEVVVANEVMATKADVSRNQESEKLPLAQLGQRQRSDSAVSAKELFVQKSWYVPPPPPPPEPPPKPTAPPLPYQYMGRLENADGAGKPIVYLSRGNETFAVSPGDKFDSVYLLEKIEPGYLLIEYVPLGIKQRLAVGVFE